MTAPQWLFWARELQAIGQTGLHFAAGEYDRERYRRVGALAAEILAAHTSLPVGEIVELNRAELGYATPKVDVRGVVFKDDKILMIREIMDAGRWTLPGGWADVNETPSESVVREVREESGFETRAVKLLAVYDRDRQGHTPPFPYHVYKLFFLCEITGGAPQINNEASEIDFFGLDALPELSTSRVTASQIMRFFAVRETPEAPTDFD